MRRRLLFAFLLVTVPPLLLLSAATTRLLSSRLEEAARRQLDAGTRVVQTRIGEERERVRQRVAAAVDADLPHASADEANPASVIARRRGLDALELLDEAGRVLASHQWPAGFSLPDRDRAFGDSDFRLMTVAEGYGAAQVLALVSEKRGTWRGQPVLTRGGRFLDAPFLSALASLTGLEVALRDDLRKAWVASDTSRVASWADPDLAAASGRAEVGGASLRWAATPLAPGLLLVMASPPGPLDDALRELRRATLAIVVLALSAVVLAALVLSSRLARPLQDLRDGSLRVTEGDLGHTVPESAPGELGDLARTFNAMTAELRASRARLVQAERVAAWRDMARRMAHELKKPLFPIQLSLETLRRAVDRGETPSPPFLRATSDTVLGEVRSMNRVVDAFTEVGRLPRPRLVPTDLAEVVDHVLALYAARAGSVRVEKSLAALAPVPADPDLLARALGNLVANALEAMPEGGTLRLRTREDGEGALVDVEDTGTGLGPEAQAGLFVPFKTTKPGGTGLGLAIVQGIVSDHGGRVDVGRGPEGGARFTIVLPRVRS